MKNILIHDNEILLVHDKEKLYSQLTNSFEGHTTREKQTQMHNYDKHTLMHLYCLHLVAWVDCWYVNYSAAYSMYDIVSSNKTLLYLYFLDFEIYWNDT